MKIKVKLERRKDVYIVDDRESLKAWIKEKGWKQIHNLVNPGSGMFIGADHDTKSVLEDIEVADRVALCTGVNHNQQMGHELSLIMGNEKVGFKLEVYDIGKVTEDDLEVKEVESCVGLI